GGEPPFFVQRLLTEYHGTVQAARKSPEDPVDPSLRELISKQFRLSPSYIADLPILQIVYGYQVGTSNLEAAKVRTFDRGWDSVALTHRMRTEAALFDLDPRAVAAWVSKRMKTTIDELALHKMLIRPDAGEQVGASNTKQQVYQIVESLLH